MVVEKCFVRRLGIRFYEEEVADVVAVDFAVGGEFSSGESGEGGEKVEGRGEFGAGGVGWDFFGPAHDTGDAHSALMGGAFRAFEGGIGSTIVAVGAVVGGEDDEGVFVDAEVFEGF